MKYLYKICLLSEVESLKNHDAYSGNERDQKDGYIHLSQADQVERIARKYYSESKDLVLLKVRSDQLGDALKWEENSKGEPFPHLYGTIAIPQIVEFIGIAIDSFDFAMLEK